MKAHTQEYKEQLKTLGKEIDAKITYTNNGGQTILTSEEIWSVNPHYKGSILKSVMKQLDFVATQEVPIGTEVNYQFGLKVNGSYEYVNYGNYIVEKSEKQEDTNTFKTTCYDKMLYSMKDYEVPKSANLLDFRSAVGGTNSGVTAVVNGDGTFTANGTSTSASVNIWFIGSYSSTTTLFTLTPGTYYIKDINLYAYDGTTHSSLQPGIRTIESNFNVSGVRFPYEASGTAHSNKIYYPLIAKGNKEISFIPYGEPTYPITIRNYMRYLCDSLGLGFANESSTFTNYDQTIPTDLFKDLGYTYRDVLDQLAEVTGSTICINNDDELEVRYLNDTQGKNLFGFNLSAIDKTSTYRPTGNQRLTITGTDNPNEAKFTFGSGSYNRGYFEIDGIDGTLLYNLSFDIKENTSSFTPSYTIDTGNSNTTKLVFFISGGNGSSTGNTGQYFILTNIQLEVGSIATDYEPYGETINEEFIKNTRAEFGEKYGPVNSIVLSRSGESDNVYLRDDESIEENGLTEIKIVDNQIMNDNTRDRFLPGLLERLDGLEYYPTDFESIGITYLDLCDKYNVKVRDNYYNCVMLSDEIEVSSGLNEIVYADPIKQGVTDYTKADKTDRRINQTTLIVDKQQQTIDAIIGTDSENFSSLTELKLDVDGVDSKVESNYNFVRELSANNTLSPEPMQTDGIIELRITGNETSSNPIRLRIADSSGTTEAIIDLPIKTLLTQGELQDVFTIRKVFNEETKLYEYQCFLNKKLDYIENTTQEAHSYTNFLLMEDSQKITDESGTDLLLEDYEEGEHYVGNINMSISEGTHTFRIVSTNIFDYYAKYAILNDVIDGFATKANIVSEINQSPEEISISANKIKLEGYTTINEGFSVDMEGNMICNNATANNLDIRSGHISLESEGNDEAIYIGKVGEESSVLLSGQFIEGYGRAIVGEGVSIFPTFQLWNKWDENVDAYSGQFQLSDWNGDTTIEMFGEIGHIDCVSLTQTSIEEKKKNFELLTNALEIVKDTDIYKYNFKKENDDDKKHIGFVIGDKFNYREEITSEDNKGAEIYSMVSVLWQAVKEQQEQIKELQKEIDILKGGK